MPAGRERDNVVDDGRAGLTAEMTDATVARQDGLA